MKKLAIKGHNTRYREVIDILKMLGGKDSGYAGQCCTYYYYINDRSNSIEGTTKINKDNEYKIFTLEEFLEKYPFKVGDKVEVCGTNKVFIIGNMIWEDELCTVHYANMEDIEYYTAKELKPYKETNTKDNTTLNMSAIDYNNGLVGYEIPEGYEFDTVIDNKVVLKKLKPTYPKTYEECCNIIECCVYTDFKVPIILPYDAKIIPLLENIRKLLICRDTYWDIAGEQMGLGKPWEPDWNEETDKFTISNKCNKIYLNNTAWYAEVLSFPTAEMRDAFYENFKDLIERCKELL